MTGDGNPVPQLDGHGRIKRTVRKGNNNESENH